MALPGSLSGTTLDEKYRIDELIGRGGMGDVYLATHLGTSRQVAVKVIGRDYMADETAVARFAREARAAGQMRHPNIVDVTDFGFAGSGDERVAYLVMERLIGETLRDRLNARGRLPVREVVHVLTQVGAAVTAAHERGIVHRDLKPDNIWIERDDKGDERVKVLDFGLAKLRDVPHAAQVALSLGAAAVPYAPTEPSALALAPTQPATPLRPPEASPPSPPAPRSRPAVAAQTPASSLVDSSVVTVKAPAPTSGEVALTEVGVVMGTPLYMSPEQWMGVELDARSDIYSMAIIAFELIAGAPPFLGSSDSVGTAHLYTKAPSLADKADGVPPGVVAIIAKALEKERSERPATAQVFASALQAASEGAGAILLRAAAFSLKNSAVLLRRTAMGTVPFLAIAAVRLPNRLFVSLGLVPERVGDVIGYVCTAAFLLISLFLLPVVSGVITPVVADLIAVPRRPVRPPPRLADVALGLRRTFLPSVFFGLAILVLPVGTRVPLVSYFVRLHLIKGLTKMTEISGQYIGVMVALELFAALLFAELTGRYVTFPAAIMVEGLGGVASLRRSAELTRPLRGPARDLQLIRTLTFGLASLVVVLVVSEVLGAPISDATRALSDSIVNSVGFVLTAFVQAALFPFFCVTFALFYVNTRLARGEALDSAVPPIAPSINPDVPSRRPEA